MYIPLQLKTDYSLLSSLITVKKLIEHAKDNNLNSIAITDTTLNSSIEFYRECVKNNIKPIIGLEVKIKESVVLLYCKNYFGYKNLIKLSTIITERELTSKDLIDFKNDLFVVLPCVSFELYKAFKKIYKDIFIGYSNNLEYNKVKHLNNIVYINNVLALNKKDTKYINYLNMIKLGKTINDYEFLDYDDNYLKTKEEIKNIISDYSIYETIYNMCDLKIEKTPDLLPKYRENNDEYKYLTDLCLKGLRKRLGNNLTKEYLNLLKYELEIINKMGFCNYFLVVYDYVKFAKKNNIIVGPGRGSAAGSLVSYTLGITNVDPVKYGLLFERFLNPERVSMPDIDIDFEDVRRDEVRDYCINKYGNKKVSNIVTYSTLAPKQVIRDVARTLDISSKLIDSISKSISNKDLKFTYENDNSLKLRIDNNNQLKKLYSIALVLEGLKRNTSIHAAGIVMSNKDLDEVIPLIKNNNNYLTGFTMEYLEDLGLLKMDFLGLKNLTIIKEVVNMIKKDNTNFDINNISLNDKDTLKIFYSVNTVGIFQFESPGMKNFLRNLRITSFDDIVAAIALFRPGPMEMIPEYIARKNGKKNINYIHENLKSILESTYGIIIYQEQIMQIANVMAGYSLGEADVLRRAMSKKKIEVMNQESEKFISGCINRGYTKEISEQVWNFILKFASYGFNKSHSVAYSLVAYQMAYLKAHYKDYFFSYLLTNVIGSDSKTKEYMLEAKINKIEILKPDINLSNSNYTVSELGIRTPLSIIKGVGNVSCNEIIRLRNIEYKDFFDFVKTCYGSAINKGVIENLIYAGCFNSFGFNKKTLINNVEGAINYAILCKDLDSDMVDKPLINKYDEYSNDELLKKELEVFGFYFSKHPTDKYKVKGDKSTKDLIANTNIKLVLLIDEIKVIETKKKDKMAFVTGSDEYSTVSLTLFPNTYKEYENLEIGNIVKIYGKTDMRNDKLQIIVDRIENFNE